MRKPLLALAGAAAVVALQAWPAAAGTGDLDCVDVETQAEALRLIEGGDPHGLDEDNDGWPCESKFGESRQGGGGSDDGDDGQAAGGGDAQLPRTGPEEDMALMGGLLVASGTALVVLGRKRRTGRHVLGS